MSRRWTAPAALVLLTLTAPARAGGIGSAMIYGPYTGGHLYSYNVAYSYGLPFSPADSWNYGGFGHAHSYHVGYPPYLARTWFTRYNPFAPARPGFVAGTAEATVPPGAVAGPAVLTVTVPPGAEVWVEGDQTAQTGAVRTFQSPALPPGKTFVYMVRARWKADGRAVEQVRPVEVSAGAQAEVRFTGP